MELEASEHVTKVGNLEGSTQSFSHNDKKEGGQRVSLYVASRGTERIGGRAIKHDRKEGSSDRDIIQFMQS